MQTRARSSVIVFLDAITWLAQIVMFVLLGPAGLARRVSPTASSGAIAVAVGPYADRQACRSIPVPGAVQVSMREMTFISWVGLRGAGGDLSGVDPMLVGLPGATLFFRRRLRRGLAVAAGSGLDGGAGGAQARHVVCTRRPFAAPRRTGPAGAADSRDRRLSGACQQPVPATRFDPELGTADAGHSQRGNTDARRSESGA
jgi:hypothetical protein